MKSNELFDACICNPPFHSSKLAAQSGSQRKWKNLGKTHLNDSLNFGGSSSELWCPGGERAFIGKMIQESSEIPDQVRWFTSLVSKEAHLPFLQKLISKKGATEQRVIPMSQGQKKSRLIAWTYFKSKDQQAHDEEGLG